MRPVLVRGIDGVFRPSEVAFTDDGTDLRDDVARAVFLMSLAAVQTTEPDYVAITGFERLAQDAYAAADAMLKARKHGLAEDPNKKGVVA
ncbi:hypothetical protein [Klebsiella aerogenes]|uniref:hypothetical protein n=1 Tax=Klebsiella aerogenes TaxID=548 RepID=UPI0037ABBE3B